MKRKDLLAKFPLIITVNYLHLKIRIIFTRSTSTTNLLANLVLRIDLRPIDKTNNITFAIPNFTIINLLIKHENISHERRFPSSSVLLLSL